MTTCLREPFSFEAVIDPEWAVHGIAADCPPADQSRTSRFLKVHGLPAQ
jgi:hypothetical protein